jgi:DNA polymerase-3 subunit delta
MAKDTSTLEDLLISLGRRDVAPLYLLCGEEDFLVDEAVQAIVHAVLGDGERGFNLDVVSAAELDVRDILALASSFPMMAERRVVVVRDIERITGRDVDVFAAYCENPSRSTCLVLVGTKPDFRKKPFSSLKRNGWVMEAKPLYENQIPSWITGRIQKAGRTITPEACKMLTAYVGSSLREIQNELEKLYIYIGERKEVTADDVAAVVGMSKEYTVFELQKAVGARDMRRAVGIIQHMLDAGESVPFIVVMLTNYFTALWKLHDMRKKGVPPREQAAQARINPYFLQEYVEALGHFSPYEVERAFLLLAGADEEAKSTSREPAQILTTLIIQLTGQGELVFSS